MNEGMLKEKILMGEFKRTPIIDVKKLNDLTVDNIYWKRLDFPVTVKENGFINGLDFSPIKPYHFAVSHSTKVDIYDPSTNQPSGSLTRFKKAAYGNSFRKDGKLIVVGGEDGRIQLFSVESRSQLRTFKGHTGSVYSCKFLQDNQSVVSFSDDSTVRCWDIATEKQLSRLEGHADYVRCGAPGLRNETLIVSGSYDHTVRIWDTRQNGQSVLSMDHGYPVEALLLFPNDSLLVSAGGTIMKVWDIGAGGKQLVQLSQHHKTITSLCFCSENRRILSGSLDRHVKIYDTATYQVVHSLDYPSAVVKIGVSADDNCVVAAMTDGLLSIQHRSPEKDSLAPKIKRSRHMRRRYFVAKDSLPYVKDEVVVEEEKRQAKLQRYDQYLRTFQYTKALNAVLSYYFYNQHPEVTVSVIRELMRRRALKRALAGRTDEMLQPVVNMIAKNISRKHFTITMIEVANDLLDVYGDKLSEFNDLTKILFRKLNNAVNRETYQLKEMASVIGVLDVVKNSVPFAPTSSNVDNVKLLSRLLNVDKNNVGEDSVVENDATTLPTPPILNHTVADNKRQSKKDENLRRKSSKKINNFAKTKQQQQPSVLSSRTT